MTDGASITTKELVESLARRGLHVTENMLGQDVSAKYLPPLVMNPRGPRGGIGRSWTPWAVRRAVYLYRLRRRGVKGPLLRLLLFLEDGWGWESVKPICTEGLAKFVAIERSPLARRVRTLTPSAADFVLPDATEGVFVDEGVPRFTWGMGFFGQPLPGGSLQRLFGAFAAVYGEEVDPDDVAEIERVLSFSRLTWSHALSVIAEADSEAAEVGRQRFNDLRRRLRRLQWRYLQTHGQRDTSANPLSLCGTAPEELRSGLRSLPGKLTPAQCLGGSFSVVLVSAHVHDQREVTDDLATS